MSYESPDPVTDGVRVKVITGRTRRRNRALSPSSVHSDSLTLLFPQPLRLANANANPRFVFQAEVTDPQVSSSQR